MKEVPAQISDITTGWLTEALALKYPGTEVVSMEILETIVGAACKVKIGLEYNDAGLNAGLPKRIIAKSGFVTHRGDGELAIKWDELMTLLNATEARFYRDFAPALNMNLPLCLFSSIDPDTGQSIILLEDLSAAGSRFGSFDKPLDADAISLAFTQLALLHARWWADPMLAGSDLKDAMVTGRMLDGYLVKSNWDEQMSRPRGKRVPLSLQNHDRVSEAIRQHMNVKFEAPTTMIHGDPHIGNMYFKPDGTMGFLDWQLMCQGKWAHDVVFCITGAMTIEDRRLHEKDLLKHYLRELASFGAPAPSFSDAWRDYRRCAMWGFLNLLTPGDKVQSEEYNTVVGERFSIAVEDLDTLDALGVG